MYLTVMFSVWICLILFASGVALGGDQRELHVDISYTGMAVSFNLYKNNVFVCNRPSGSQLDCTVDLDATPMSFTLTSVEASGLEGPRSLPFVLDPLPQAKFTTNVSSGVAPLVVNFDASASLDYGGLIVGFTWDFGDGEFCTLQYADHIFTAAGTYTVRLTVVNDIGASHEKTSIITVKNGGKSSYNFTTITTVKEMVQQLYVGYLGRAADQEGLDYWANEITNGVLSMEQLRANLTNEQSEYLNLYANTTRAQLVSRIYFNLFLREPDPSGLTYWTTGEGGKVNADQLIVAILNGASESDRLVFDNKVQLANYYTTSCGAAAHFDILAAAAVIDVVEGTYASVTAAEENIDSSR